MVSHIQKLAHVQVVRTSNAVSSNKCGGITYLVCILIVRTSNAVPSNKCGGTTCPVAKFMEYDFRLTVGTLT